MLKRALALVILLTVGLLSFGIIGAQEATEATEPNVQYTIGDIVANKDQYYGQELMTEGTITDLINIRAFVLSDGDGVGNSELLVINSTDHEFDLAIKNDQRVRLIGTLYSSFNDGGWDQFVGMNTVNGASPVSGDAGDLMATQDVTMLTPVTDMLATEEMMAATAMPDMMATVDVSMPTAVPESASGDTMAQTSGVDLSQMYIPENLRGHTILVLTSLDTITYIETE